jgi:hypothetical protein
MSYRKQRALRRILQAKRQLPQRRPKNIDLSEKSLQKSKDYVKKHTVLHKLPLHHIPSRQKEYLRRIQYLHELRLAKLLDSPMPPGLSKIVKLPDQDFSFLEKEC